MSTVAVLICVVDCPKPKVLHENSNILFFVFLCDPSLVVSYRARASNLAILMFATFPGLECRTSFKVSSATVPGQQTFFQVAHKRRLRAEDQAKLVKEILISGSSRRPSTLDFGIDGNGDGSVEINVVKNDDDFAFSSDSPKVNHIGA